MTNFVEFVCLRMSEWFVDMGGASNGLLSTVWEVHLGVFRVEIIKKIRPPIG